MSNSIVKPNYAADVPFVPMNWGDRDAIVGPLMEILEAVMPQGKQLEATKGLVKNSLSNHFRHAFNSQYEVLCAISPTTLAGHFGSIDKYYEAIWKVALKERPSETPDTVN